MPGVAQISGNLYNEAFEKSIGKTTCDASTITFNGGAKPNESIADAKEALLWQNVGEKYYQNSKDLKARYGKLSPYQQNFLKTLFWFAISYHVNGKDQQEFLGYGTAAWHLRGAGCLYANTLGSGASISPSLINLPLPKEELIDFLDQAEKFTAKAYIDGGFLKVAPGTMSYKKEDTLIHSLPTSGSFYYSSTPINNPCNRNQLNYLGTPTFSRGNDLLLFTPPSGSAFYVYHADSHNGPYKLLASPGNAPTPPPPTSPSGGGKPTPVVKKKKVPKAPKIAKITTSQSPLSGKQGTSVTYKLGGENLNGIKLGVKGNPKGITVVPLNETDKVNNGRIDLDKDAALDPQTIEVRDKKGNLIDTISLTVNTKKRPTPKPKPKPRPAPDKKPAAKKPEDDFCKKNPGACF